MFGRRQVGSPRSRLALRELFPAQISLLQMSSMTPQPMQTVFIVDDDHNVRKAVAWLVESADLKAETYASAQSFLEAYQPGHPGCLVLDHRMPGMDGLELLGELRPKGIHLPVIILTGHGSAAVAARAMRAGAMAFLDKPFDTQDLLAHIHLALEQDARQRSAMD